ncbi:MAG: hypothetical protein J6M18_00535 [Actinomycetaceae bacterium]|nr:hypothetical protein [Actinomycetaceae bacterium]
MFFTAFVVAMALIFGSSQPAHAFSSSNTVIVSGVVYKANAYSCTTYFRSCSWNGSGSTSVKKAFTLTTNVRGTTYGAAFKFWKWGNGVSHHLTSATSRTGSGKYLYHSGVVRPGWSTWRVFNYSVLTSGLIRLNSGNSW